MGVTEINFSGHIRAASHSDLNKPRAVLEKSPTPPSPKRSLSHTVEVAKPTPEPAKPFVFAKHTSTLQTHAQAKHLWALGIVIVLGGQYISWNVSLHGGFGWFLIATVLVGAAYVCLCCSLAEMTSCLQVQFAGGSYAFTRATIGLFPGFLVGSAEAFEYIMYVAATVIVLGEAVTFATGLSKQLEPLYWVLFYASALPVHLYGGEFFWRFNLWFGVLLMALLASFWVLTAYWMDFTTYAALPDASGMSRWFNGGIGSLFAGLAVAPWWYVGVESLPLSTEETHEHQKTVPKGLVSCAVTLYASSLCTLFAVVSLAPGITEVADSLLPLSAGYKLLCNTENEGLVALWSFPALYGTAFGFVFSYGRQLFAMSRSGMYPALLSGVWKSRGTPAAALLAGSAIGFVACVIVFYSMDEAGEAAVVLFSMFLICAMLVYTAQLTAYLILRTKYTRLPREYHSPVGVVGAVFAMIVFWMCLVGVLFYPPADVTWEPVVALFLWFGPLTLWYVLVVRHRPRMSPEEEFALFALFTVKYNTRVYNSQLHAESSGSRKRLSVQKKSSKRAPSDVGRKAGGGSVRRDGELGRSQSNQPPAKPPIQHDTERPLTPGLPESVPPVAGSSTAQSLSPSPPGADTASSLPVTLPSAAAASAAVPAPALAPPPGQSGATQTLSKPASLAPLRVEPRFARTRTTSMNQPDPPDAKPGDAPAT